MVTKHILETIFGGSILPVITFFPGENDSLQSVYLCIALLQYVRHVRSFSEQ